jgi:protease IV
MPLPRAVRVILFLIAFAVFVSVAGTALIFFVMSRGPSVPATAVLVLKPGGDLRETAPDDVVGQLFGNDSGTLRAYVNSLRKAKRDPRIKSVLLIPRAIESPYWGKVQELRDAVMDFRRSGKKVTAYLEYGGDREYYLASAADRVFLMPASTLDLTGVASYEIFLRGTFDKIGAYPDFVKIAEYKTAPNQYTEREMTPAHREMATSLNRDMYDQLVRTIAEARKKNEADVRGLVDQGPFRPEDALRVGLVDGLAYEDQIDDRVPEMRDGSRELRRIDGDDYDRVRPESVGIRTRSRIGVLYATGAIVSGNSGFDPVNGAVVGSDTLIEQIRRLRDDSSLKAIVLRIDSPGGSSVASDVIWRELMITRDQKPSRPLIVSMSDLAASGGYYIATPGQVIVAEPATLTGSIGIYAGKLVTGGTVNKLGITEQTVKDGANADIYSPFAPWSEAQRDKIGVYIQGFYKGFLDRVAQSRKKTPEEIDAVGRGRVWTGAQAKERGLVDELGGLERAVSVAKEKAGIPADEDVELVSYSGRRSLYDAITSSFRGNADLNVWRVLMAEPDARALASLSAPTRLFRRGEPLALMPYTFLR